MNICSISYQAVTDFKVFLKIIQFLLAQIQEIKFRFFFGYSWTYLCDQILQNKQSQNQTT
jgi:hypothetical protein